MMQQTFPIQERSVEELIFWWPQVVRRAGNDWAKGFALSIMAASRRRNWKPTEKQLGIMRRMVADFFTSKGRDDEDMALIE